MRRVIDAPPVSPCWAGAGAGAFAGVKATRDVPRGEARRDADDDADDAEDEERLLMLVVVAVAGEEERRSGFVDVGGGVTLRPTSAASSTGSLVVSAEATTGVPVVDRAREGEVGRENESDLALRVNMAWAERDRIRSGRGAGREREGVRVCGMLLVAARRRVEFQLDV